MSQYSRRKRLRIWLGEKILILLLLFFWFTCRVRPIVGEEHILTLMKKNQPIIPCVWHQMLVFGGYYLRRLYKKGLKVAILISPSADGELIARVVKQFGSEVVRGSATRTGSRAIREMLKAVNKQGMSLAVTPDGPKGPLHYFKPGAIMVARMTQAPIVPVVYAAEKSWRLKTWDNFILPKPFSRIQIVVGEPIYIDKKISSEDQEQKRIYVEKTLMDLAQQAQHGFN